MNLKSHYKMIIAIIIVIVLVSSMVIYFYPNNTEYYNNGRSVGIDSIGAQQREAFPEGEILVAET